MNTLSLVTVVMAVVVIILVVVVVVDSEKLIEIVVAAAAAIEVALLLWLLLHTKSLTSEHKGVVSILTQLLPAVHKTIQAVPCADACRR